MASDQVGYCSKEAPHSTNPLVNMDSMKPEPKSKRNHAVLIQWLETHHQNPYPTKAEKHYLACYANMTQRQLNDWFANARRNIKKVGYPMWKAKHSPSLNGGRSRHHNNVTTAAVHSGGSGAQGMLPGALDSKTTYRFPTFYPPPATAAAGAAAVPPVTPSTSYLPASTTRGLIPLPIFNRGPITPAPFPSGTSNPPSTLYTLYPPHTSGQCSCRYCTTATAPVAALSSHSLGTLPVLSGFNSSLTQGILKYDREAPSSFIPLNHIAEIIPISQPLSSTVPAATQPSIQTTTASIPSPQQVPQELARTPPNSDSLTACQPSPSSIRSVTPLEQPSFPNTPPCPTLPTSSESASIASGCEHDVCESVITATVPNQELCALNPIMYNSRRETKPLFHLPTNNLELQITSSSSPPNDSNPQGNPQLPPQWMWNGIDTASTQPLYEAELPELPETPSDDIKGGEEYQDPADERLHNAAASTQVCVEQAN